MIIENIRSGWYSIPIFCYSKGFPVFVNNLYANVANSNVYIEFDLLPWVRLSEMQLLMESWLSMQYLGQREQTQVELERLNLLRIVRNAVNS